MNNKEPIKINIDTIKKPYDVKAPTPNNNMKKNVRHSDRQLFRIYKTFIEPNILNKRNVEDETNVLNFLLNKIKNEIPKKENKIDVLTTGATLPQQNTSEQRQFRELSDWEIRDIEDEMSRIADEEEKKSLFFVEDDWEEEVAKELNMSVEELRGDERTPASNRIKDYIKSSSIRNQFLKDNFVKRVARRKIGETVISYLDRKSESDNIEEARSKMSTATAGETEEYIKNEYSGKIIKKSSPYHMRLIKQGVIDINGKIMKK